MGGHQDLGTVLDEVLEGGDRRADAGVVGDDAVLEGDVEVAAHEHGLALEIGLLEVADGLLRRLDLERSLGRLRGDLGGPDGGLGEERLGGERGRGGGEGGTDFDAGSRK